MLGMSILSFEVKVSLVMDYAKKKTFTLHLFARNADKHSGFRGEGRKSALHHPSSPFIFLPFSDSGLNDRSLTHASIKTFVFY